MLFETTQKQNLSSVSLGRISFQTNTHTIGMKLFVRLVLIKLPDGPRRKGEVKEEKRKEKKSLKINIKEHKNSIKMGT